MEHTQNKIPRKVTEGAEATCNHCGTVIYREFFITENAKITKVFSGSYKQECDERGDPIGAVIPFCNCKGELNA